MPPTPSAVSAIPAALRLLADSNRENEWLLRNAAAIIEALANERNILIVESDRG